MVLTIEFSNGGNAEYKGIDAFNVQSAIDRTVKIGDIATPLINLKDGSSVMIFLNNVNGILIKY